MLGLLSTNDVTLSVNAKAGIINAVFNDPNSVPATTKWLWLGNSVLQTPLAFYLAISRVQDKDKLFEAFTRTGTSSYERLLHSQAVSEDKIEERDWKICDSIVGQNIHKQYKDIIRQDPWI